MLLIYWLIYLVNLLMDFINLRMHNNIQWFHHFIIRFKTIKVSFISVTLSITVFIALIVYSFLISLGVGTSCKFLLHVFPTNTLGYLFLWYFLSSLHKYLCFWNICKWLYWFVYFWFLLHLSCLLDCSLCYVL